MLNSPICLVLGAGSSVDFGENANNPFPLGDTLRQRISNCLNIEVDSLGREVRRGSSSIYLAYREIAQLLQQEAIKLGNLAETGRAISRALPGADSIDDLLERHPGKLLYEIPAKLGIIECILNAERKSPLYLGPNDFRIPSIEKYSHHWLSLFLRSVTKGCATKENLVNIFDNLRVVNFNYDRCFEWFTYVWLRHVYAFSESDAREVMDYIHIIHPYGSIGELPIYSGDGVPFGIDFDYHDLAKIYRNIRTYSESIEGDRTAEKISSMVSDCPNILFLGFAFHPQNMNMIKIPSFGSDRGIYATIVDMPRPRWETAQGRIWQSLNQDPKSTPIRTSPISCADLIQQYSDRW